MYKKFALIFVMLLFLSVFATALAFEYQEYPSETVKGRVLYVVKDEGYEEEFPLYGFEAEKYLVEVKILQGQFKGEIFTLENIITNNPVYDIPVKKGDKVVVLIEYENGQLISAYITDYVRDETLLYLFIVFAAIMMIIGKYKGFTSLLALVVTAFAIIKVMLPLMLKGYSPVLLAILVSVITTALTYLLIGGISIKTLAAFLGTIGGVIAAGLLAFISGGTAHLTGLSAQEAQLLLFIPQDISFNFRELLFAGIIIGALGAVMDVAMSIASSMTEIYKTNPKMRIRSLVTAGMNVGKDIMGTMSNTLILAYTGSALPLLLLFMAYETDLIKISNLDLIATEVVRALASSIGLLMAIPLTALTFGVISKFSRKG